MARRGSACKRVGVIIKVGVECEDYSEHDLRMYGYFRQIQSEVSLHCVDGMFDSISCIAVSGI